MSITNEQAEAANDYIRDHADEYAKAKAERVYLEQYRKSQKAILMQEIEGAAHIKEAYAYSHEDYLMNLKGLKEAVFIEEKTKWMMVAAQNKIEMWRTYQANGRRGI